MTLSFIQSTFRRNTKFLLLYCHARLATSRDNRDTNIENTETESVETISFNAFELISMSRCISEAMAVGNLAPVLPLWQLRANSEGWYAHAACQAGFRPRFRYSINIRLRLCATSLNFGQPIARSFSHRSNFRRRDLIVEQSFTASATEPAIIDIVDTGHLQYSRTCFQKGSTQS